MISVDDHVLEHPRVWLDRLPAKYAEVAPQVVREGDEEYWVYEGKKVPTTGLGASAGRARSEFTTKPLRFDEMRPGCYDSKARLEDMNVDGVLASLCFPSFPRFCGQVFHEAEDRELALLCVQAYNDWMIDEWCGSAPGRFIPLTLIPLWDPQLAVKEIERCKDKGASGFCFSEGPSALGLPSLYDAGRYWDPVLKAAEDTGMVVCTHIGSSSRMPTTAPDCPMMVSVVLQPLNAMNNLTDWLFSGALVRFPQIKVALSEGGIGWIPATLERAAYVLDRHRYWAGKDGVSIKGQDGASLPPEVLDADLHQLFRDHIYGCFIDEEFGVANLDAIGIDNVMAETDYPHSDSSWPNSRKVIHARLAGRTDEEVYKILQGNAIRVFDFTPAPIPQV
ncbi:amidohydrolase family protein [Parafrankia elaeagni]|uniref:amidohydrolase family protein n=1 Tax=Parafrankia elaeagni TaxID=222534 RepID=UPI0003AAEE2A|nr:amidohydrolase family protein [Parafrankia elaeagni]